MYSFLKKIFWRFNASKKFLCANLTLLMQSVVQIVVRVCCGSVRIQFVVHVCCRSVRIQFVVRACCGSVRIQFVVHVCWGSVRIQFVVHACCGSVRIQFVVEIGSGTSKTVSITPGMLLIPCSWQSPSSPTSSSPPLSSPTIFQLLQELNDK